jgi:hypothetical protein
MEADAALQVERVDEAVGRNLPAFRKSRDNGESFRVLIDQPFEYPENDGGRSRIGRVNRIDRWWIGREPVPEDEPFILGHGFAAHQKESGTGRGCQEKRWYSAMPCRHYGVLLKYRQFLDLIDEICYTLKLPD